MPTVLVHDAAPFQKCGYATQQAPNAPNWCPFVTPSHQFRSAEWSSHLAAIKMQCYCTLLMQQLLYSCSGRGCCFRLRVLGPDQR
jgi:hypothetical protein